MIISNFAVIEPTHSISQEEGLEWLALAHAKAGSDARDKLFQVGMGPGKIQRRSVQVPEFFELNWEPENRNAKHRSELFAREVDTVFETFYPEGSASPDHLIHVTCTGYVSPSGAQKLVSRRGMHATVTHAYHMGCYAAFPALRIGQGYLNNSSKVDVVHTEMCILHVNPTLHETEQLVVQTLFADGFIKYTLSLEGDGFEVLALHEEFVPNSEHAMTWSCEDWGMRMTITKEVPVFIARAVEGFFDRLLKKAGLDSTTKALYAIHPGGPKIIDQIAKVLHLSPDQIAHSTAVLRDRGNMSSGTLPHVWNEMLSAQKGQLILSVAFGPGLSISGGVFRRT